MGTSKIEWCDAVWNPITGCSPVSEGCTHCWARRMARRLAGRYGYPEAPHHFDVTLHPDRLDIPLRRKKSTTYFVCSMSDLFHDDVPLGYILNVFYTMAKAPQHTYQVLTKRPERMLDFFFFWQEYNEDCISKGWAYYGFPLKNVWLGVTAENQEQADKRIPILLQTPAAVRFVSVEPMLGAIDISDPLNGYPEPYGGGHRGYVTHDMAIDAGEPSWEGMDLGWQEPDWQQTMPPLDWVICGGESGPSARPMHPDWARDIRDQCQAAGVPFFFKQWGAWFPRSQWEDNPGLVLPDDCDCHHNRQSYIWPDGEISHRVGKKAAGRLLDGREWNEMPERDDPTHNISKA